MKNWNNEKNLSKQPKIKIMKKLKQTKLRSHKLF